MSEYVSYTACRADAQTEANRSGADQGLEYNPLFKFYRFWRLPKPENRFGHELRCEVVRSERKES